jgi:hypothetical protein
MAGRATTGPTIASARSRHLGRFRWESGHADVRPVFADADAFTAVVAGLRTAIGRQWSCRCSHPRAAASIAGDRGATVEHGCRRLVTGQRVVLPAAVQLHGAAVCQRAVTAHAAVSAVHIQVIFRSS